MDGDQPPSTAKKANWLPAVALGLLGFFTFAMGAGFFILIAAVLVSPPVHRWLGERAARKGKVHGTKQAVILSLAVIIGPWIALFALGLALLPFADKIKSMAPPTATTAAGTSGTTSARVAPPKAAPAPKPTPADGQAEVTAMWTALKAATKPCDDANQRMSDVTEALGKGSTVYTAYDTATWASKVCWDSSGDLSSIPRPKSFPKPIRKKFDQAIDDCQEAYLYRSTSLTEMATVFNGDRRPSRISTVKGLSASATTKSLTCIMALTATAQEAGVKLE